MASVPGRAHCTVNACKCPLWPPPPPRPHSSILHEGEVVGEVTSGTKSPSVEKNIALGYVPRRLARPGTAVQIDIRGRIAEAVVVKPPFYARPY